MISIEGNMRKWTVKDSRPKTQWEEDLEFGESVAKLLTALWNSQKNPGKVYVGGYRVHHGAIGLLGGLASAYLDKPIALGFFNHLMEDDKHDAKEWFAGEKLQVI